jgi:hypothetical protein
MLFWSIALALPFCPNEWNASFEYKKSAASATVVATASATTIAAKEQ